MTEPGELTVTTIADRRAALAESRLAAATELLGKVHEASAPSVALLCDIGDFLAAQPAATAQPRQQDMTEDEYYAYQPAAPHEHQFIDLGGKRCCVCGMYKTAAPAGS